MLYPNLTREKSRQDQSALSLSLMLHHIFRFCLLQLYLSHMQIAKTHAKYRCNHDFFITLVANRECFSWVAGHRTKNGFKWDFFDR